MQTIRIVPATDGDVAIILELIQGLAEYERLAHCVTATEAQLRATLFGPRPSAEVILAYSGDECAGFAVFFGTYSTFLAQPGIYLEDLYVKPHLRGKGIGFALLKHLAQLTVARGCGRLEWAVLNWNEPSIQFYRKLGAEPLDEWTAYRLSGDPLRNVAGEIALDAGQS